VIDIDSTVHTLVRDMIETMYNAPGVGLAANQIGIPRRVAVFDVQDELGPRVMINPLDLDGNEIELAGDGIVARVLLHEVDHLDGLVLIDRLPKRVRKHALKELRDEALGTE